MKFWDNVGDPLYFPTPLSDCPCRFSFRRLSLSLLLLQMSRFKCRPSQPLRVTVQIVHVCRQLFLSTGSICMKIIVSVTCTAVVASDCHHDSTTIPLQWWQLVCSVLMLCSGAVFNYTTCTLCSCATVIWMFTFSNWSCYYVFSWCSVQYQKVSLVCKMLNLALWSLTRGLP